MLRRALTPGKVAQATKHGFRMCAASPAPLATLARLENALRSDATWLESEVRMVDTAIRRILAQCTTTRGASLRQSASR